MSHITNVVLATQFFNTGILILIVNSNLVEHWPYALTKYTETGKFTDYQPFWYSEVGYYIVQSMMINSMMPYATLMTSVVTVKIFTMLDGGDPKKTKCTSMAAFKATWGCPDYIIHFKFANLLNVIYVTMMYGLGMPILFPIAAFNFLNQYICERIIVAYYMKLPPALDA